MKKSILIAGLLAMCSGLFTGCTTTSDCTVLSSRLVRLSNFDLDKADRKPAYGDDVQPFFLGIPLASQPSLKQALDNALDQGGGDVMTDVRVKYWNWNVILFGEQGWSVSGSAVKTRD